MSAPVLVDAAAVGEGRAVRASRQRELWTTLALFLLPAVVLFTAFVVLPILDAGYYAFFRWNGYGRPQRFVGLGNFQLLFASAPFLRSLANTAGIIAVSLLVQLPLALLLALLVSERSVSNTLFRMIFFVPFILSEVATGLIWSLVYDGDYGLVAALYGRLGISPLYVLSDRHLAFPAICAVVVWKYFGFHMMIYIAALQGIPQETLEAAVMDGASRTQIVLRVKIPMIRSALAVSVFFAVLGSLQLFDLIVPLTNGGPSNTTHSIVSFLYTFGLQRMNVGFGSAVGVVLFVICTAFAFTYRRTVLREEPAR